MTTEALLQALADGEFHSGEELGQVMAVSRTAVWKQVKKLEELGLDVESVKGRGYRLAGGVELLDKAVIERGLLPGVKEQVSLFDVLGVVESTNKLAMEYALSKPGSGYVCTAEQQTAGRGRRGKPWHSPYAGNIYLSVVWEFASGAAALEGLSLAVGVAVVDALNACGVEGVQLKWPNDLLFNHRKLAGILLEMTGDAAGPCQVVVGIGLNVMMSSDSAGKIDQPWVDVDTITGGGVSRNQLMSALLNQLLPLLAHYERDGFAAYREQWQQLDAFAGQQVFVSLGQEVVTGKAAGVDSDGALVLETASGRRLFSGGEVSLRRVDDS